MAATALAAALLVLLAAAAAPSARGDNLELFVSPSGSDDSGSGTAAAPFATIDRALEGLRGSASASSAQEAQVLLLNGTYNLEKPVRITAADTAGGRQLRVAAVHPGAASLNGGVRITGWTAVVGAAGVWTAALPLSLRSFGSSLPRFRQLFVDGVRANRTQFNATVRRATAADLAELTGKETRLVCHSVPKLIISPRQARDKHRENSKKDALLQVRTSLTRQLGDTAKKDDVFAPLFSR